jgi:hypothetical protein
MNIYAEEPRMVPPSPSDSPGWGEAWAPPVWSRLHPALDLVIIGPLRSLRVDPLRPKSSRAPGGDSFGEVLSGGSLLLRSQFEASEDSLSDGP